MIDILIPTLLLFIILYIIFTWNNGYFKERKVSYLKPLPFVGNALQVVLFRQCIADFCASIYNQLKPKGFGGAFFGPNPVIMVCDPALIKLMLVNDFEFFYDRAFQPDPEGDPITSKMGFFVTGPTYKFFSKKTRSVFGITKLKRMFLPLLTAGHFTVKKFVNIAAKSEPVNTLDLGSTFALDLSLSIGGISDEVAGQITENLRKEVEPSVRMMIAFFIAAEFPWVVRYVPLPIVGDRIIDICKKIITDVYRERVEGKVVRNDLANILVDWMSSAELPELQSNGKIMSDSMDKSQKTIIPKDDGSLNEKDSSLDDFIAIAVTYIIGSVESNARVSSFGFYELAMNPDIQRKLQEEIDSVLEECDGRLTFETFQKMEYLDKVTSETLRKYTPFPITNRVCVKDYKIPGTNFVVEKGMHVYVSIKGLHYDPDYFPEPQKFDPERFSEENKKTRPICSFLPFGAGPRICVGAKFTVMVLKVIFLCVLNRYELYAYEGTITDFSLDPKSFFVHPKEKLLIKMRERESYHEIML